MLTHSIMDPTVGTFAGSIVELTDLLTEDSLIPTDDIPIPTEDIPPASDNILARFTVGITGPARTAAKVSLFDHLVGAPEVRESGTVGVGYSY